MKKTKVKKKKKMKLWKKILLVVLLILAIFIGWFIYKVEKNGGGLSGMLATLAGHDENTRKNLGELKFLILGISTDQEGVDLTDTIMVASYNPANQTAALLSIPRDTFTGTNPSRATSYDKINAMYSRKHRADETLEAVNQITGLDLQYYMVVKTESLIKLVDVIGGIDFDVPINMDYDDTSQDLHIHLTAGMQHLNGDQAEQLVRFRHNNDYTSYPEDYGDNDTGRMRTQREFIIQTIKQTVRAENMWKVFDILDVAKECLETNMNFDVAKDYVPYAVDLDMDDLLTEVLPGENTNKNSSGTWIFVPNKSETKKIVDEMFLHRTSSTEEPAKELSHLKIEIINASGSDEKLEIALHEIKSLGYEVDTTKSDEVEKTMIVNQKNVEEFEIKGIKDTLQKGIISNSKNEESIYDVKIIIGKDYEERE